MISPDQTSFDEISIETADVIDWDEAMEQVAGDEDFLHELLNDFKEELGTQMGKLSESIEMDDPARLLKIRSAAHIVKGSSANLYCKHLRSAAADLEMVAKNATKTTATDQELQQDLEVKFELLKKEEWRYQKFCAKLNL